MSAASYGYVIIIMGRSPAQRCARNRRKWLLKREVVPEYMIEDVEHWRTDVTADPGPSNSVHAILTAFETNRRRH